MDAHRVEAPRAQQRGIEDFGPIGGGEKHHAATGVERIELDQQLGRPLLLVVETAARGKGSAGAPDRVEVVDEKYRRRVPPRLLEQVAQPCGAISSKYLDEFTAPDRNEWDPGLASSRASEQRLAGSGRANQQQPLGGS